MPCVNTDPSKLKTLPTKNKERQLIHFQAALSSLTESLHAFFPTRSAQRYLETKAPDSIESF